MSKALIKENLKQYWYLPVLSLVIYFLTCLAPYLMSSENDPTSAAYYIGRTLENFQFGAAILMVAVPVISAALMMNFLHNQRQGLALHSQPFSRNKIFASNVFSGLLMCIVPVLIMGILFMVLRQDAIIHEMHGNSYGPDYTVDTNVYTYEAVLNWVISTVCAVVYFYGFTLLGAALTGTVFMQVAVTFLLTTAVPILMVLVTWYFEICFESYGGLPEFFENITQNSNPIFYLIMNGGLISTNINLLFLGLGLAAGAAAWAAYKKVKLERIGDSFLFKSAEEGVTSVVTLIGGLILGLFFAYSADSKGGLVVGILMGTLVAFAVIKIVINKTVKIFNKKTAKSLALVMIIAIAFCALTVFDITGYDNRVPKAKNVEKVSWYDLNLNAFIEAGANQNEPDPSYEWANDPENIEKIIALHEHICQLEPYEGGGDQYFNSTFEYVLKNGKTMTRRFNVALDETTVNMINEIISSDEFLKENNIFDYISPKDITEMNFSIEVYNPDTTKELMEDEEYQYYDFVVYGDDMKEPLEAFKKDFYNITYPSRYLSSTELSDGRRISTSCTIYIESDEKVIWIAIRPENKASMKYLYDYCKSSNNTEVLECLEELI